MQRFQGLDRHRPCGALPAGGWSTPFLPPFVGMTPLATDGPGSGSGAGFGRDHAEKWQSGGVSCTTLMVTNVTDSVSLNPLSTRTCVPSPRQILPAQAPSSSTGTAPPTPVPHRRRIFLYPTRRRDGAPLPPEQDTRQRQTTSLGSSAQHQNKPSSWTHLYGADQTSGGASPHMTQRQPLGYRPVPPLPPRTK